MWMKLISYVGVRLADTDKFYDTCAKENHQICIRGPVHNSTDYRATEQD
jgi:hypothetical protein